MADRNVANQSQRIAAPSPVRPSGIPRPSKLPVPKVRPPPASSFQPVLEDVVSPVGGASDRSSRLLKRASMASLQTRSSQSQSRDSLPVTGAFNAASHSSKHAAATRNTLRRSASYANLDQSDNASAISPHVSTRQSLGAKTVEPIETTTDTRERSTSRPSLADRTVESLHSVPSTPEARRKSNFFNPASSPMEAPPLPSSASSQRESDVDNRPGSSEGPLSQPRGRHISPTRKTSATVKSGSRTSLSGPGLTRPKATQRSVSSSFTTNTPENMTSLAIGSKSQTKTVPPPKANSAAATASISNKTAAPKLVKPKPTLRDPVSSAPSENVAPEQASEAKRAVSASSSALRQQIAAAKAAARKERAKHDSGNTLPSTNGSFDPGMHDDPFNQGPHDDKHILRNRISSARTDGRLNIAALRLKEIPAEVLSMYSADAMQAAKVNWAEVVDLTKLIAADNELETIDEAVFPDKSADDLMADDQTEGNQFGGLELLDLHGNSLLTLPPGLSRLGRLTRLNLSHNKLENPALDIICQIKSLKELKLDNNIFTGTLPLSMCMLPNLEVLHLQANRLLSLPEALRDLTNLKVLNIAGNQLTALPMEALQHLPLTELDASRNALIASLFPPGDTIGHPTLQTLCVANNSLAALTFSPSLHLPSIRSLDLTNNHLTSLPPVTAWTHLTTLSVADNKIALFPEGFTTLPHLRNANFTSNEIRLLDPEIARLPALDSLILASNPLREKKFLSMPTADLKRELSSRLAPDESDAESDIPGSPVTIIAVDDDGPSARWTLRANGLLELANQNLTDDLLAESLPAFLLAHEVKHLDLQDNKLTTIPSYLSTAPSLRILNLSGNPLTSTPSPNPPSLPSLTDLNLSRCRLTSLSPLTHLSAPSLLNLNISVNRLTGPVPSLRPLFPSLQSLFAADNKFSSVTARALRNLHTVNLASNDIAKLPPAIGLLWGYGLRSFEIGSNAFRIPNYRVLDKGTEATLRWLRDKLPADAAGDAEKVFADEDGTDEDDDGDEVFSSPGK